MSNEYEFFKKCLKTAQTVYENLINTPKASGVKQKKEVSEILEQIKTTAKYGEITSSECFELTKEFLKLDFGNLSAARAAKKTSLKMNQT